MSQKPRNTPDDGSIDAGLLLLAAVTPRGVTWTQEEIAFVCGCSRGYIWLLEKQARAKIRQKFEQLKRQGKV
jgi:transcriptional regulator